MVKSFMWSRLANISKRDQGLKKKRISYQYLHWKMIFRRDETRSACHMDDFEGNQISGEDG